MKEMLTIYNDELEAIGVKSRDEVHKLGFRHRVVQCHIIKKSRKEKYIYFQQRAYDKDICPGMYDIACAGHVDEGEEFLFSMKRELFEEVGIRIQDNDLKYVGTKFECRKSKECVDNEICELFLLKVNSDDDFKINEEVLRMVKSPLDLYEKWVKEKIEVLPAVSLEDNKIVELNKKNSCPHIFEYSEYLLEKMKEL